MISNGVARNLCRDLRTKIPYALSCRHLQEGFETRFFAVTDHGLFVTG